MTKYIEKEAVDSNHWILDEFVDLEATPGEIWPWLAQMGNGRAGWYSYDLLDNLGKKSFEHIDAELVKIQENQKIPFATISKVEVNRLLTYRFGSRASMTYLLEVLSEKRTRLRARLSYLDPSLILRLTLKPAHIFMQNKQFAELKKRVEKST